MDTHKLKVLLKSVDTGSFLRASEQLGYTQSGITHMMNSLEEEMGFPLLLRTNRGVQLTQEGRQLAPILRQLVNIAEHLEQECALIQGLERGHVRVGSFTSITLHWLPEVIWHFQQEYPNIDVQLMDSSDTPVLEAWLAEGRVDILLYSLPPKSPFQQHPLAQDPFLAVLPTNHSLLALDAFPVEAFAGENFLMFQNTSGYDDEIHDVLKSHGIQPTVRFSSNIDQALVSMVAYNLGVSILPGLILKGINDNVSLRPLSPPHYRTLGLAVRSPAQLSPAASKFIACAKTVIRDITRN